MTKHLHIVCFDVPYPVSHGGYFDLFYKLKAFHDIGTIVHLHCFEYGRGQQPELEKYCADVTYYPRKKSAVSLTLPYIVSSRINKDLILNLSRDNHPILLEGTHCTYMLYRNYFPDRAILYRLHNIEHIYYWHLYKTESNLFKKAYYLIESKLLEKFEKKVGRNAWDILTVSEKDRITCKKMYRDRIPQYIPLFHPFDKVKCRPGKGKFILYHGNLSVAENDKVAVFLIRVFAGSGIQVVIAGRNPSQRLVSTIKKHSNFLLKPNPDDNGMEELIRSAHINIVYSLNATGIKIKLLHAIYSGRHCVVNEPALPGGEFDKFCHIVNDGNSLLKTATSLMETDFKVEDAQKRSDFLLKHFDNKNNAGIISALLRLHYQKLLPFLFLLFSTGIY